MCGYGIDLEDLIEIGKELNKRKKRNDKRYKTKSITKK